MPTDREIFTRFHRCPHQKVAFQTLMNAVCSIDYVWVGGPHSMEIPKSTPEHDRWLLFTKRLAMQLMVFGYAIYRVVDVPEADGIVESSSSVELEVGDGHKITMTWDPDACKWTARYVDDDTPGGGGWELLMLNEPIRVDGGAAELDSYAARAYAMSCTSAMLTENSKRRDYLNTQLLTWTQYAKAIYTSMNGRDVFDSAPTGGIGGVYGKAHFEEWVASTSAKIKGMHKLTTESRKRAMAQYKPDAASAPRPDPKPHASHVELPVGMGLDAEEVSYRRAPEDLPQLQKSLRHAIMMMYNVAPQATGENVNAERVAGSDRLSQMAIAQHMDHVKYIRSKLQTAISAVSRCLTESKLHVVMKPCMGTYNLNTITPILTTEAAQRMYACIYEVPESDISVSRLDTYIDGMNEPSSGDKRSANAHDGEGTGMTQAEMKQDKRNKKNMT